MDTREFIVEDQAKTLFPIKTSQLLIQHGERLIAEHIAKCFDENQPAFSFLPQQRVYAAKHGLNLRRTVKPDPVAEYYIYNLVNRHRRHLRKPHDAKRSHFGYRFTKGAFLNPSLSYKAFKTAISKYTKRYKFFISFDVASYFNSLYHHDLAGWLLGLGAEQSDYRQGKQLRFQVSEPPSLVGQKYLACLDLGRCNSHATDLVFVRLYANDSRDTADEFLHQRNPSAGFFN
jgi:hypothetical protein